MGYSTIMVSDEVKNGLEAAKEYFRKKHGTADVSYGAAIELLLEDWIKRRGKA